MDVAKEVCHKHPRVRFLALAPKKQKTGGQPARRHRCHWAPTGIWACRARCEGHNSRVRHATEALELRFGVTCAPDSWLP